MNSQERVVMHIGLACELPGAILMPSLYSEAETLMERMERKLKQRRAIWHWLEGRRPVQAGIAGRAIVRISRYITYGRIHLGMHPYLLPTIIVEASVQPG